MLFLVDGPLYTGYMFHDAWRRKNIVKKHVKRNFMTFPFLTNVGTGDF